MGHDLSGSAATADDARCAIATIAPAPEILEMRGTDMRAGMPLAITGNGAKGLRPRHRRADS